MDNTAAAILVAAFLTGIGGFVTAVVTAILSAKKSQLNALQVVIEGQGEEIDRLNRHIDRLEKENEDLRIRLRCIEKENDSLRDVIANMKPGKS